MPKDWEVGLGVVGDEIFSILSKFLDWETLLGSPGDALKHYQAGLCGLPSLLIGLPDRLWKRVLTALVLLPLAMLVEQIYYLL